MSEDPISNPPPAGQARYFSVIVPTFNRAHLLPRCLESILAQTFDDFEIIVADDGSIDETRQVVDRFRARDARARYAQQENKGAGDARNLGVSLANGRYLIFLDSDDETAPLWLEKFEARIRKTQPPVVCCGFQSVSESGTPRIPKNQRNHFLSGTFAVRSDVFAEVGGYAPGLPANQHTELRMRLFPFCEARGWNIEFIEDVLVNHHAHSGPKIRGNPQAVFDSARYIIERHGERLRQNSARYANWAAACGGAAAKLGRYRDSRQWFREAIAADPARWKNYFRLFIAASPLVRSIVWGQAK